MGAWFRDMQDLVAGDPPLHIRFSGGLAGVSGILVGVGRAPRILQAPKGANHTHDVRLSILATGDLAIRSG